jgi:ferredoxin-thioredoxin reductase catalytic subunit
LFIKLFILLYADDTVIFSETREEMQNMLDVFTDYCKQWKLYVNIDKTKAVKNSSISLIYNANKKGDRFSPCRTPILHGKKTE